MCSNTSSSSTSGGGGGGGGGGNAGHCDSYMKKSTKRPRVPRRGPGVAELEKMLREQESENDIEGSKIEGFPSSSFHSSSNSRPGNVPIGLGHTSFSPPLRPHPFFRKTSLYDHRRSSISHSMLAGGDCCNNGGFIGGLSTLPEQGSDQMVPSPTQLMRKQCRHSSPTINQFPESIISSSSIHSSARQHNHVEPPSNQVFHQRYTFLWPEADEEKIVGTKRALSFSDNVRVSAFQRQVPPFYPNMQKTEQSPSYSNHGALYLEPSKLVFRGAKPGGFLELMNSNNYISAFREPTAGNFLSFGPPSTSSPWNQTRQRETCNLNSLPLHDDSTEDSYKRPEPFVLFHKKTFTGLTTSEEQLGSAESTLGLATYRSEPRGGDVIDLNLKL